MKTIAILNLKGGTAKTVTAAIMARCLAAEHDKQVLLIDADQQGKQSDAQYIESRAFSVEEISRFTGIPKHMLQSGQESYESNAQQRVVFVQDTLAPYVIQWEQENSFKCLLAAQRRTGLYFKGNLSVLMRGDDKSRAEFYVYMIQNCVLCPDECRSLEERNPIPGGLGGQFLATKNLGSLESVLMS